MRDGDEVSSDNIRLGNTAQSGGTRGNSRDGKIFIPFNSYYPLISKGTLIGLPIVILSGTKMLTNMLIQKIVAISSTTIKVCVMV